MASRLQFSERGDRAVTEHFKRNIIADDGQYRKVKLDIVLEVTFNSIQPSTCHASGLALRFPRIKAIRRDKNVDPIDTLQYARDLAEQRANLPADFDQARNLRLGLTAA